MGWLGNFELDRANDMFWQRHTLSNGQVCMIGFVRDFSDGGTEEYNVVFAVADKKKQLRAFFEGSKENTITLKSTGKCGVEALYWAKDKILEFEEEIIGYNYGKGDNVAIIVTGEEKRRFRLYEKALSRYGYKKVPGSGAGDYPWYMKKILVKKGEVLKDKN